MGRERDWGLGMGYMGVLFFWGMGVCKCVGERRERL